MIRNFLPLTFFTFISIVTFGQLNVELLSQVDYPNDIGNDVWGYVDTDGSEYAIFGTTNGVSVVNITDPSSPEEVDFINQQGSMWRDIKTWGDYAYVTSDEGGTTNGLLIIDMTNLPDSISYRNYNMPIPGEGVINTCHNLYIDENGFLYLAGCSNLNAGGLIILDVATTPGDPIFVSKGSPEYSHDVFVRDNLAYSSEINIGFFTVYDVTNKDSIVQIASQATPFNFTHNTWLSDDSNILFTTDELANAPVASYDISDLDNIKLLDEFRPLETIGDGVIPHNVHVFGNWLVISYYSDGCIIVDATKPDNLVEVGNWDTFLGVQTGFNGAWGAYPYFPSGNIIIGDIGSPDENGNQAAKLFVLGPDYKRAGYLEGSVSEVGSGNMINGAKISIETIDLNEVTDASGGYKTGTPIAGDYMVTASAFGYVSETKMVTIQNGEISMADFELESAPRVTASINVFDATSGQALENIKVNLSISGFEGNYMTDLAGNIAIDNLLASSDYVVVAGDWGYKYDFSTVDILDDTNVNEINIELESGYEDNFDLDLGWTVESNAAQGDWERVLPFGISPPGAPIEIAPGHDADDEGNFCFVTGNANDLVGGLLFGETTLTSPVFDATTMLEPVLSYDTWFWASTQNGQAAREPFEIYLENGIDTVRLDSLEFDLFGIFTGTATQDWQATDSLKISDYLTPTDQMRLIVNVSQSGGNAVDAGFDGFQIFDVGVSPTIELVKDINIKMYPNPSQNAFYIDVPEVFRNNDSRLEVISIDGKVIDSVKGNNSSVLRIGEALSTGVYFVQFANSQIRSKAGKIIKI
jgi:choice-of-anchor B domain-containing protein